MKNIFIFGTIVLLLVTSAVAQSVPVLLYHGLTDSEMPAERFSEHMSALRNAGYKTVTENQVNSFLDGTGTLPTNAVLITFDDGRDASFYPADPILQSNGFRATMFTITKQNTKSKVTYYMNKSEMQKMLSTGRWEVEAHGQDAHEYRAIDSSGKTAPYLVTKIWLADKNRVETTAEYTARVNNELQATKDALTQNFSVSSNAFAFPFGQYGQNPPNFEGSKDILLNAAKSRYASVYYQTYTGEGYSHNVPGFNTFLTKRITVSSSWSGSELVTKIARGKTKKLPYFDTLSPDKGWDRNYGNLDLTRGVLTLRSSGNTAALAYLDGTAPLQDYAYTTTVKARNASTVSLIARMENPSNYLSCDFSNTGIKIYQNTNGKFTRLAELSENIKLPSSNFQLTASVNEDELTCTYANRSVKAVFSNLDKGGIGIKVSDSTPNKASVRLEDVRITAI